MRSGSSNINQYSPKDKLVKMNISLIEETYPLSKLIEEAISLTMDLVRSLLT
jgi:hypothetical protein